MKRTPQGPFLCCIKLRAIKCAGDSLLCRKDLVDPAHHADDAAGNREVLAVVHDDRAVLRVCSPELDVVRTGVVVLDRRLVVDLCDDDFSLFGALLLASENQVAVEDARVDHGVALDAECEDIATAGKEVAVDGDRSLEVLDGENRLAGSNAAYDGNFDGVVCCGFLAIVAVRNDFETAAETGRAVDVALLDEGCEDGAYAVRRRNLEVVAYFAHGRRHVVLFGVLLYVLVDFCLTVCQFLFLGVFHLLPRFFAVNPILAATYINIVHSWANVNSFTAHFFTFFTFNRSSSYLLSF